jgi:site-specific recombinase XerD
MVYLDKFLEHMLTNQKLRSGNTVSQEQLNLLQEFNRYLVERSISLSTRNNYISTLRLISYSIGKTLDKSITKKDLEQWLENISKDIVSTKVSKIIAVKKYFKWLYYRGTNKMKKKSVYPTIVDWIEMPNNKVEKRLTSADILTQEEVKNMINACNNTRDRAVVSLLFDSGLRRQELVNLNVGDIHIKIDYSFLTVRHEQGNKTGARDVILNFSVSALKEWLNVHPFKDQQDKPLFVCLEHGDNNHKHKYCERLQGQSILRIVKQVSKDAGINKRVFVHLFRHSRNTDLENKNCPRDARVYMFGWSKNSHMPEHYGHLSKEQVIEKIRIADGLKPQPQLVDILKPVVCPRCNEQNSPTNKYCGKCTMPLDEQSMQKIIMQSIVETTVERLFNKRPELQELAKQEMLADPDLKEKLLLIKNPEIQKLLAVNKEENS